jgi:hypothetical protein
MNERRPVYGVLDGGKVYGCDADKSLCLPACRQMP